MESGRSQSPEVKTGLLATFCAGSSEKPEFGVRKVVKV
jgi:hypothetical protein